MKSINKTLLAIALAGLTFSPAGMASDGWQYEITPYIFFSGMKGDIGIGGLPPVDIDASFGDIADNLEAGFMGMFTARNGPLLFSFDGSYTKLEGNGPLGLATLTNKLTILQGNVGYRVLEDNKVDVDALAGVRYMKLEADLTISPGSVIPGGTRSTSDSWADFVVGGLATVSVAENVDLIAYVDLGGGSSDFTWQTMLGVNWQFAERWTAKAGYRYLDVDYEDNGVVFDIALSGPYLGVGFAF